MLGRQNMVQSVFTKEIYMEHGLWKYGNMEHMEHMEYGKRKHMAHNNSVYQRYPGMFHLLTKVVHIFDPGLGFCSGSVLGYVPGSVRPD